MKPVHDYITDLLTQALKGKIVEYRRAGSPITEKTGVINEAILFIEYEDIELEMHHSEDEAGCGLCTSIDLAHFIAVHESL